MHRGACDRSFMNSCYHITEFCLLNAAKITEEATVACNVFLYCFFMRKKKKKKLVAEIIGAALAAPAARVPTAMSPPTFVCQKQSRSQN